MNLPISWGTAVGPASRLLKQTAEMTQESASHLFGSLLRHETPVAASGRSEAASASSPTPSPSKPSSWEQRKTELQSQLSELLARARNQLGLSPIAELDERFAVEFNESLDPQIVGAEPLRSDVQKSLLSDPTLATQLKSLARDWLQSHPLSLMPGSATNATPVRLKVDFS